MPGFPRTLRDYARDAAGAFRLAPVEVLLGVGVAAAFSASARADGDADWWWRIAAPALLAFLLVFAASLLRARGVTGDGVRWGATAAVLLLAAVYGAWVFHPDRSTEGWRWLALFGAAGLALTGVPVVGVEGREARRDRYWRFAFALKARLLTVLAYGLALWAALAGAVAAVTSLFELNTPGDLYEDIFGWIFFALVPWVVVGGIPELVAAPEREEPAPRSLRLLGRYLYVPVLAVYLAILLAYVAKVVVTGEFPRNLLSPIVLVAGLGGLLGSVFLEPLRRDPEHAGVARLVRVLPLLLLPLLPFALWAVWVRTGQYGWTEPRYLRILLLVALTGLSVAGAVRFFRGREPLLLTIPLVLGVGLLLGAVGPWSASAVSRRDQQARLRAALREAGLLDGGRVRGLRLPEDVPALDTAPMPPPYVAKHTGSAPGSPAKLISRELYDGIRGSTAYLYDAHGPGSLRGLFAAEVRQYQSGWTLADALPVRARCEPREPAYITLSLPDSTPVRIPAGVLYQVEATGGDVVVTHPTGTAAPLRAGISGSELRVRLGHPAPWTARIDLRPLLARAATANVTGCDDTGGRPGSSLAPEEARFPLVGPEGRPRGEMIVTMAMMRRPRGPRGTLLLEHVTGMVIVTD